MKKQLPKKWVECSLGEIAEWGSGGTPNRGISSYYNGTIPWLKTGDLNDGLITEVKEFITDLGLKNSSAKIFPKNSVVIAMYGATIGKTGILDFDSSTNQACAVAVPYFNMNKFIYLFLKSEKENFIEKGKGGAQPNISQSVIKSHRINLPPLLEQNRIVEKLENLFSQLEIIKNSMASIPLLLKDFRQQILTQAVTGKLTEEWRKGQNLESSETFINTIIEKRIVDFDLRCKLAKQKGERKPLTPEYFNYSKKDLKTHSINSWFQSPVGFLCDCIVPGRDKPKSFTGTIPWVTTPDLITDYITNKNARLFLSENEIEEVKAKIIPVNSVVISIVGRFGVSCITKIECVINQQLHVYLPSELIVPEYLMFHIKTQENFMNDLSSSTTIAYINKTKANSIPINVPSLKEQQEIVSRVQSLFTKADAIEQQYKSLKEKINALPQALLHKAFKGELTEQLDSDGDGRELLQQIQELKNNTVKTKKATVKKVKNYPEYEGVLGMVAEK